MKRETARKKSKATKLGCDHAAQSAAGSKLAGDLGADGLAGGYNIVQDTVDRIFIKDAEISVRVEIHFQRLQL